MTPVQFKSIARDIMRFAENGRPVCAFALSNGQILTGRWELLNNAAQVIVLSLVTTEAPPIYINVFAVEAVAVSNAGMPAGQWPS